MLGTAGSQTVSVPTDFHCNVHPSNGNQWEPQRFGYQHHWKQPLFVDHRRNMGIFDSWVNYSFKKDTKIQWPHVGCQEKTKQKQSTQRMFYHTSLLKPYEAVKKPLLTNNLLSIVLVFNSVSKWISLTVIFGHLVVLYSLFLYGKEGNFPLAFHRIE